MIKALSSCAIAAGALLSSVRAAAKEEQEFVRATIDVMLPKHLFEQRHAQAVELASMSFLSPPETLRVLAHCDYDMNRARATIDAMAAFGR